MGRETSHKKKQEICCFLCSHSVSQTHSCTHMLKKSHKVDLHFSVVTLQQIKSLVEQDFLAVTAPDFPLEKHGKDRISTVRLGFLAEM